MQETIDATTGSGGRVENRATANFLRAISGKIPSRRVETMVEALSGLGSPSESVPEVAHDARNMVTALDLYCELLEEPGVLATPFSHYGQELRLVAAASRRLVEKLVALDGRAGEIRRSKSGAEIGPGEARDETSTGIEGRQQSGRHEWDSGAPIANLAAELMANRNLLSALAGPAIALTVHAAGGAQAVLLTSEDLTRVLVNLVKNASEAMLGSGRIHIELSERPATSGMVPSVTLAIEDNGPGIPADVLGAIFTSGFTTHGGNREESRGGPFQHRGLGLAITRSIIEGAGGRIAAQNREPSGVRIEIELPVRKKRVGVSVA